MLKIIKAVLANTPRARMSAAAFGAAIYAAAMLFFARPHNIHDGFWALGLCLALIWGVIEARPNGSKRPAVPDERSQIQLT